MPTFTCDLAAEPTPLTHHWEHTVGSGHAPLALRADWQRQLQRCHEELGFRHVRFHGLLSDPMATLIKHGDDLLYSFFNADQIMDFLLETGMRPFVELSFMPAAIAAGDETVFSYRSLITPPRDYGQWAELVEKLAGHWVERYGLEEVRRWYFECWNEPNIKHFWTGTREDYFKLYRATAEALQRVDAGLQVGGPATAQNEWLAEFLAYAERRGLPVDFLTTHYYPTDAFGQEGAPTREKLAQTSPDAMAQRAQEARAVAGQRPVYYTEWNIASNPRLALHDLPFAAAFATYIIMSVAPYVDGYSWWTFSDIFEELYFPSAPFHGGFGLLTLHGIPKPVYRAFQLLHGLGDQLYPVSGSHDTISLWVAGRAGEARRELQLLLVNQAMPRQPIHAEMVDIQLQALAEPAALFVQRIDADHANPRRLWQEEMGAPRYLRPRQVDALQAASQLRADPLPFTYRPGENDAGALNLSLTLPPQSVAAVTLQM